MCVVQNTYQRKSKRDGFKSAGEDECKNQGGKEGREDGKIEGGEGGRDRERERRRDELSCVLVSFSISTQLIGLN